MGRGGAGLSKRKPKHRYSEKEATAVYEALTPEERSEYNDLVLGNAWGPFPANDVRLSELDNLGFARIKEGINNGN